MVQYTADIRKELEKKTKELKELEAVPTGIKVKENRWKRRSFQIGLQ